MQKSCASSCGTLQATRCTIAAFFLSRLCIYVVVARIEADQGKIRGVIELSICKAVLGGERAGSEKEC